MRLTPAFLLAGLLASAAPPAPAQDAEPSADYTTAELLVDLARDYGLNQQGQQTDADVQHVRTLLRAALRLDPAQTAAHVWLYELAVLGGDDEAAAATLRDLLESKPMHAGAFEAWLAAGLAAQQTVEARQEWLEKVLHAAPRPPATQALIHLHLARLALTRLDRVEARLQLDRVLSLDRWNAEGLLLSYNMLEADTSPEVRLRLALRALQANPLDVQLAWETGELLDRCGAFAQAGPFYEHALDMQKKLWQSVPVSAARLLGMARNLTARGDLSGATRIAQQAMEDRDAAAEAGIYLYWLLTQQGRASEAASVREKLAQRFAALHDPDQFAAAELAQAAWYYCEIDPQPQRSLLLAEEAVNKAPLDTFAARVLGFAQALNQRKPQARQTLEKIAATDAIAAAKLATLLHESGDTAAARKVISKIEGVTLPGPGYELFSSLPELRPTTQPSEDREALVNDFLGDFDRRILQFFSQRDRFVEATATTPARSLNVGEPWLITFTLTNRSPFPISLGPEAMLNPVFLVSVQMEGDRTRSFPNLLTVSIDHERVITPGASVSVRRAIDVGPVRLAARQAPQQLQRVTVSALLDAERLDEQWQPSARGVALRPLAFNRLPVPVAPETLRTLFSALQGESDRERFRAVQTLAQLLGEAQRAGMGRLSYRPEPVPLDRIDVALRSALASESWELRVRTLEALQDVGLDAGLMQAARGCVDHPHWLVRLMAIRLLARQGPAFRDSLSQILQAEADELVRAFGESILNKWATPAAPKPPETPQR